MPAVLVHGVPDTPYLWERVIRQLARTDVVTPNLPGFAAPIPDAFDATKDAYAAWLTEQVEAIGEPVDLVGHDWGSMLVQRVVSTRPDLIRTWAAGGGAVDREYVWHEMAQVWQTPEVGEQIMEGLTADALVEGLADQLGGRERAAIVGRSVDDTMKRSVLALYRSAVHVGAEWGDAVDTITKPGVVFWGADDPYVTPDFGVRLSERTGARLVMFEDSGHWWPVTKPVEVARELEALWGSV
jgi:pimeloyl-ACP methyl ester carboxylesterase